MNVSRNELKSRRLGVFLFYDSEGIVDGYVSFLLSELKTVVEDLIIVVNGKITSEGRQTLSNFTDDIVIRENQGFDAGAWQEIITQYCGFEKLRQYEELVLCNDSFFGPFIPLIQVFDEMETQPVDFWGLSAHGEVDGDGSNPYGYRPRYIQTYFLVFRTALIRSDIFSKFWHELPVFTSFEPLAEQFSSVLTQRFADAGFRWRVYSDTSDLDGSDRKKNYDHHSFNLYEMIAHRKYPVLKRRSFSIPKDVYLRYGDSFDLQRTLDFLREKEVYDLSLIFDHLLRKYDPTTLKEVLNLNFILAKNDRNVLQVETGKTAAVAAHLFYTDLFPMTIRYFGNIPLEIDLLISTDSEEKKTTIHALLQEKGIQNKVILRVVEPRGREWAALLIGFKDLLSRYDYVCFVHDKRSFQKEYATVGRSFCDMMWENSLGSKAYICNVIHLFESHPELGFLSPPPPYWGTYFKTSFDYWAICFEQTRCLADRLNLSTILEPHSPPLALGSVFWCKTEALGPLFKANWNLSDFEPEPLPDDGSINHALERIPPFVAASEKYLSGWVFTEDYARAYLTDLQSMSDTIKRKLKDYDQFNLSTYEQFVRSIEKRTMVQKMIAALKNRMKPWIPKSILALYRKRKVSG